MSEPGMISLAGGLPSASLFPFSSLKVEAFRSDTYVNPEDLSPPVLETLSLARNGKATDNTLSKAMQYTAGTGDVELTKFCYDFVKTVFKPARNDFQVSTPRSDQTVKLLTWCLSDLVLIKVLLNAGNTDAWAKVVQLLCEPGEYILVEEFVYPSAQHFYIPLGCKGVPIAMDGDGLIPEKMEDILDSWEQTYPGQRKPHV
jgi:aromatic amino acid aminotransferase I